MSEGKGTGTIFPGRPFLQEAPPRTPPQELLSECALAAHGRRAETAPHRRILTVASNTNSLSYE